LTSLLGFITAFSGTAALFRSILGPSRWRRGKTIHTGSQAAISNSHSHGASFPGVGSFAVALVSLRWSSRTSPD